MFRIFSLQLLFSFVLSGFCFSQQTPIFRNFDVKDGLVHSYITAITQDSKGFMWIGTNEGLHRFDGKTFKYIETSSNPIAIPNNGVSFLYSHPSKNKIFIGYSGAFISVYDLSSGLFSNIKLGEAEIQSSQVSFITCIDESKILIAVSNPGVLYVLNINDNSIQTHKLIIEGRSDLKIRGIRCITIVGGEQVLISTEKGLVKTDKKFDRFELITLNDSKGGSLRNINAITVLDSNRLLMSTSEKLFTYNQVSQEIIDLTPKGIENIDINSHIQDGLGNIWIATSASGLLRFDINKNTYSQYKYSALQKNFILSNVILKLYSSSQEQIIWIGTNKGLSYFSLKSNPFAHLIPLKNNDEAIDENFGLLKVSDGTFWIFGGDTLYFAESIESRFTAISKTNSFFGELASRRVNSIIEDNQKNLWFATSDGLVLYNGTTKRLTKYLMNTPFSKNYNQIRGMYFYGDTLWLSTRVGICSFDLKTRHFKVYPPPKGFSEDGNLLLAREIIYDPDGCYVWVGGQSFGAYRLNLKTGEYDHFVNNPNDSTTICSNGILSFCRDSRGDIWISSFYNGISRFNKKTNNFTVFSNVNGLPSKTVYGALEDDNGDLWMSTNKGISKYKHSTGKFNNFNYFDGLYIYEFNSSSFTRSKDGDMFFGGIGGIVKFNPNEIKDVYEPPSVFITDFYIQNKEVSVSSKILNNQSILFKDQISLDYQKTTISFDVTLLNYLYPHRSGLAWKLKDYDNDWRIARSAENSISYTNLPPGRYDLMVKTTANFMDWSQEKMLIRIVVVPPWWMNTWFNVIVILLIVMGILLFYSIRIHYLKKQKENLNHLVQEKTEELKALNESLEESNIEISSQNEELERYRYYLEDQINERTTQLKVALLRAEESDKLKSAILSNMSHEVRTPLNAIVSYAKFIEDESFQRFERKEFANIVFQNSNSLLSLIDNIIELSRFQSENQTIVKESFCLNSFLIEILTESEKQRSLSVNLLNDFSENEQYRISSDKLKLQIIFKNLLSNAFKYTEKGFVRLGYRLLSKDLLEKDYNQNLETNYNQFILFYVEDTGLGIPAEKCEMIFDLFTKGEEQRHKLYEGLGLGLTVCKMSVEMLGGTMWLKSTLSKGSTFYFIIPI